MTGRTSAIDDDLYVLVEHELGHPASNLVDRNIDRSRQMQLPKVFGGKRFDQDGFLRMVELLLEFIALNLGDHVPSHSPLALFLARTKDANEERRDVTALGADSCFLVPLANKGRVLAGNSVNASICISK